QKPHSDSFILIVFKTEITAWFYFETSFCPASYFLASNKGRIFTKKQIYTNVWEEDYLFDDSNIMSFISKLRKKIEPNPEEPTYILTVRGVGYRFSKGE
ncbi:DNA-binding response OmpR family regulator, partial [Streptococcus rupicaprae]